MVAEAIGAPIVKLLVMREYAVKGGGTTAWGRALALFPSEFGGKQRISALLCSLVSVDVLFLIFNFNF